MPFGDSTGPSGLGPRTGHGAGRRSAPVAPGSMHTGGAFGLCKGGGGGQRRAGLCGALVLPDSSRWGPPRQFIALLQRLAQRFEQALNRIDKHIQAFEAKTKP